MSNNDINTKIFYLLEITYLEMIKKVKTFRDFQNVKIVTKFYDANL